MKPLRNLVLATIVAAAPTVGNAAPIPALKLGAPTGSAATPVFHFGDHSFGYGYGPRRLCHVLFPRLVEHFGYWRARWIKHRCYFRAYYGHSGNHGYYGNDAYSGRFGNHEYRKYRGDDD